MTTNKSASERLRELASLPLPGRHSSGVQIGIQKENARLKSAILAAADAIDVLECWRGDLGVDDALAKLDEVLK